LYVELEAVGARGQTAIECRNGVFRANSAAASVREDDRAR
jgi:hypothetical protein